MTDTLKNFYYTHPEGFTLLSEMGDGGGCDWSVSILFEWNDKLFAASDSGCSCYGPWEDVYYEGDFTRILTEADLKGFVDHNGTSYATDGEKLTFLTVGREWLKQNARS